MCNTLITEAVKEIQSLKNVSILQFLKHSIANSVLVQEEGLKLEVMLSSWKEESFQQPCL